MEDFSQEISDFVNNGTYNYMFDSVGNEILNSSSSIFQQIYFALPLGNWVLNINKIPSFYDSSFTEFIPETSADIISSQVFPQEAIDQINEITSQSMALQDELNYLISIRETDTGSADTQSIKNTIIALRTQLGQGSVSSDFQDTYPYMPVSITSQ